MRDGSAPLPGWRRLGWLTLVLLLSRAGWADVVAPRTLLFGVWVPNETGLLDASGVSEATRKSSFDLELLDAIGQRAEIGFVLIPMDGSRIRAAIAQDEIDFALPMIRDPMEPGVFSVPYRTRTMSLFLRRDVQAPDGTGFEALRAALRQGLRIGVDDDLISGTDLADIIQDPQFVNAVSRAPRPADNLRRLINGVLDGFVAVRLSGLEAIAANPGAAGHLGIQSIPLETHDVMIRFSEARVDDGTVRRIDRAIRSLITDGPAEHLQLLTSMPILLRLGAAARWLTGLEVIGTIAFALSGVLMARRDNYGFGGAFMLAALPPMGGGVMRDVLVGRNPVGLLESPRTLLLVIGTMVIAYFGLRLADRLGIDASRRFGLAVGRRWRRRIPPAEVMWEVTDALGLAAFTVLGVVVAVRFRAEPLWLWGPICAVLSGAGGGILRDAIRSDVNTPALRASIYAEVCLFWGLLLSLSVETLARLERPLFVRLAIGITVVGAFATRMFVVWRRFRRASLSR